MHRHTEPHARRTVDSCKVDCTTWQVPSGCAVNIKVLLCFLVISPFCLWHIKEMMSFILKFYPQLYVYLVPIYLHQKYNQAILQKIHNDMIINNIPARKKKKNKKKTSLENFIGEDTREIPSHGMEQWLLKAANPHLPQQVNIQNWLLKLWSFPH